MGIKIEVGRLVRYIAKDTPEDMETNYYPPIGTFGIITEVCKNGLLVVDWQGADLLRLGGGGYCAMDDVEYSHFSLVDDLKSVLAESMSKEDADKVAEKILKLVLDDVLYFSCWSTGNEYDNNDIRFAIGRVLISKLGIDI